jgi:parallel beta-helix repeat protein
LKERSMKLFAIGLSMILILNVLSCFVSPNIKMPSIEREYPKLNSAEAFHPLIETREKPLSSFNWLTEIRSQERLGNINPYRSVSFVPAASSIPHAPIYIDGDKDFKQQAKNEGWSGKGTKDKPYIIENYYIDVNGADLSCIEIRNIKNTYFIIRECTLRGATAPNYDPDYDPFKDLRAGIYLYNVIECKITENICSNNLEGMYLNQTSFCHVSENECFDNIYDGIALAVSNDNQVYDNDCHNNLWDGIIIWTGCHDNDIFDNLCSYNDRAGVTLVYTQYFGGAFENNVFDNTCIGNGEWGIDVRGYCDDNVVESNYCEANDIGILLALPEGTIIRDNICTGNRVGIQLSQSNSNELAGNICSDNELGIWLRDSSENTIRRNICFDNAYYGITLYYINTGSHTNIVIENECYNNVCGIVLYASNDNTLEGNICSNNNPYCIWLYESHDNIVQGNIVSGERDGVYFVVIVGIELFASQYNLIEDNEVSVTHYGIELGFSDYNLIKGNTVTGAWHGYALTTSSWNSLEINFANDIDDMGFWLCQDSNHNELHGNTAADCTHGFRLGFSFQEPVEENILVGNTATDCFWTGFLVDASDRNTLEGNTAINNLADFRLEWGSAENLIIGNTMTSTTGQDAGIRIWGSDNIVTENTITGNHWWGIAVDYDSAGEIPTSGNLIYHNNLIENIHQAIDWYPENNYWYHPDLLEGNYWSDYNGVDDGSGGRIAGDGIGDTDLPCYYDWYPLIDPFP